MSKIIDKRVTAKLDGDFVVFLIGVKINAWWKVHKWLPVVMAMPRMLKELSVQPREETGFLGHTNAGPGLIVQYWRSFEHLETYAKSQEHAHFLAWRAFNKNMKQTRGDIGI